MCTDTRSRHARLQVILYGIFVPSSSLNGEAVVVEAVPESKSKKLRILSAYFDTGHDTWAKEAKKKGISERADANAPTRTSDNDSQYPPIANMPPSSENVKYIDQLHRDAKVSSKPVGQMRYDDLRKEASRLNMGILNGKTKEHIELRRKRKAEVELYYTAFSSHRLAG